MAFELLNVDDPRWETLFASLPSDRQDVFYSPTFARLCQATLNSQDEVRCAALSVGAEVTLYPFARRSVGRLVDRRDLDSVFDITSLYGRGGIATSPHSQAHLAAFHAALADYCRDSAVMCGFDRYHPVMGNDAWIGPTTRVMDVGGFVVVDMRREMRLIEESFKPSVRKDLKKAERNGIVCFADSGSAYLDRFLEIYRHTMARNAASNFYYFSEDYFRALIREMPGQFHFFFAAVGAEIVSCELVLHHGKYCHSFLGGTKQEALPLCANPLLKREIIRSLKAQGAEYFLLGGGTRPNDGIFNFKKAYAPEGVLPSRVGGTIWDSLGYEQLKAELSAADSSGTSGRFQFYDKG